MNLQNYKTEGFSVYESLARTVCSILETAIKSYEPYKFHLQQVQSRAKCPKKLEDKVNKIREKKKISLDEQHIENAVKDLAGCRIIFYYNNDVNNFLNSGLVFDHFFVIKDGIKVHHSPNSYRAHHYIVELKEELTKLSEYKQFKGIKCEIQIQTLLNHAYSETTHDITYKSIKTNKYGEKTLENIDTRLEIIMENHLVKAGYELQQIQIDYQNLLEGKQILEQNNLERIINANNNERYEILKRYRGAIKYYNDKNEAFEKSIAIFKQAVSLARNTPDIPIETPYGNFQGITFNQIFEIGLEILTIIQCFDVAKTFATLLDLYEELKDDNSRCQIVSFVTNFSQYKVQIINSSGYYIQTVLISIIEKWNSNQLKFYREIALEVCKTVLNLNASDIRHTYEQTDYAEATLPLNTDLIDLRQKTLKTLNKIYHSCENSRDKITVLKAFEYATQLPSNCLYKTDLLQLVLESSYEIVQFFLTLIDSEKYEVLEEICEHVFFLYRFSLSIQEKETYKEISGTNSDLHNVISNFEQTIRKNEIFCLYMTLIGEKPLFEKPWQGNVDYFLHISHKERMEKNKELANSLDRDKLKNIAEHCVERILNNIPRNIDFRPDYRGVLLEIITQRYSNFALNILAKHTKTQEILYPSLKGLYKSDKAAFFKILDDNIAQGSNLPLTIYSLEIPENLEKVRLQEALNKACSLNDISSLHAVIEVILYFYIKNSKEFLKTIFFQTLEKLRELNDTSWVIATVKFQEQYLSLVEIMDENEVSFILDSLIVFSSINYNAEAALTPIAEKFPEKVLNYFRNRIDKGEADLYTSHYQPLPLYPSHLLRKVLSKFPELVLKTIKSWHEKDSKSFEYRGAKLLTLIYPNFCLVIEKLLITDLREGDNKNIPFVLDLLSAYEGQSFIYSICKEIVGILPVEDAKLKKIQQIMLKTGVVSDPLAVEYGFQNAYEEKAELVKEWQHDPSRNIQIFAERFCNELDNVRSKEEHRKGDERFNLGKIEFGLNCNNWVKDTGFMMNSNGDHKC
ncbi:MAG: RelA/SpoT domain-containing protein [Alphaproteobacteria bacterium]|nr:RelA/SpoT domain-containing protein [Alphaproteobacteria bacterium]